MNNILLGQYLETDSIFHRLDPRTKLLAAISIMLSFLMLETFISYVTAAIFVLIILISSKIPLHMFGRVLRPILWILAFTFVYHALTTKGVIIWSWSFIHVTAEGLQNGTRFVFRIVLLVLLASVLTLTTKPLSLAHGLEKLLSPLSKLNVPVEQFSLMIAIAIRFIPTIMQELDRILQAQQARGYDITSLKMPKRFFAYIPILIPLIIATVQRAEQLTMAIDARAYGNGKGRTVYKQLKFTRIDYIAGGLAIVFAMTLLLLR
ncbi:energy-coupling factor transporter transmembrane protein EcfT [Paenibacillus donghaensis]|uniref:energy-coupling factor transporter transmembrane component T family protein n=1 Tax=Paenibacillus donghaensis TaxID=414771 RepID=UPI001883DCEC|nr:energy-coupling factor transporter transmembrane protein EcfT [Paenibacillus donghaensis]MBE9917893.1 energy-coupling factor transporter transmembrane protein EcfT [Paenibacillus donghaensis]